MSPEVLRYDEDAAFTLADDAATVARIVRTVPLARLQGTFFGEWSALDVIGHLADTAERFADRIQRCVDEEVPELPWLDDELIVRERRAGRDALECSRRLSASHARIIALLGRPGVGDRRGRLGAEGEVPAGHLAAYQARHAHGHAGELARTFPPGR